MPGFNAFSMNVSTVNLKIFYIPGGIYKFERKFNKHSGETGKALWVYRNMKECILEVNLEGQGW